jgi:hypothetical protein
MTLPSNDVSWRSLEAKAGEPEVQEWIRREIFKGTIRVVPVRGGGIRIIPIRDSPLTSESPRLGYTASPSSPASPGTTDAVLPHLAAGHRRGTAGSSKPLRTST